MDRRSKWLLGGVALLTIVSIAATFYRTVVLQDFDVTGVWIEFTEEGGTYAWFYYDNVEYEVESMTQDKQMLLNEISTTVIPDGVANLDQTFVEHFEEAFVLAEENHEYVTP